jgi:acetamidase/formamidase
MRRITVITWSALLANVLVWQITSIAQAQNKYVPRPNYFLRANQTHNKFSKSIRPVLRVPTGSIIEAQTEEASDRQLHVRSTAADISKVKFDPIHPITGPVYVQGARVGDVLAVTLHEIEVGTWGWVAVFPGFGFLSDEFTKPYLRTFEFKKGARSAPFTSKISVPLKPFAGVMGVAPDTSAMLSTIPPRANGGNMDNPCLTVGTTVYFPVFVEGALFSIGDTHAAQGMGEICGTAIEAPMRIVYEVNVIKKRPWIREPHYETEHDYAVTAFGTTLDGAAKKASRYMIDYLVAVHGLSRNDAYVLCSLAGNLHIAQVVDMPHVLVSMHIAKSTLGM